MSKGLKNFLTSNRARLSLIAFVGFFTQAQAQQFSADLFSTKGDGPPTPAGRLRVADDRVRLETPELADGFFLIDGAKPVAYFVRPAAHVFMEARQSSRLTRLFVQVDPGDPCREWQAMTRLAGLEDRGDWHCERAGEEPIVGHNAAVFRAVSASGQEFVGWIDPVRKFPLRIKTEDGTIIAVENIRDEAQAAQQFEIPPGFRRFDPQHLIQRIKQSDVWVDGENGPEPSHRKP